jgi:type I restriction enzyme S subunit
LYWYMSFITPEVRRRASGTTFLEISKAAISEVPLRIPPTAEQERIVAAIEEEFSRIEAGVAAIARAQRRLNALVGAAMDSIVTEAAISDPGWRVLSPTQIAANVPNALAIGPFGSDLKVSDYRSDGVPLIFVRNIRERTFSGARLKFIAREKADELRSHAVRGGDVLITKMGDPPGDTAVYPTGLPNAILTADCIKLTPAAGFDAQYLALVMRTRRVRNEFLAATRGVAQQKLSLDRFKRQIHLPVPEFDEQVGIAQRLDLLASRVRKCADEMNEASRVAQALRSAVLVAAFSGRLGPQDPKDEPASVLLERTTRGREPSGAHPKRRSHGYRPKVSA